MLRRVNEEWGTAVLLAEHRLERCLPAADRVIALEGGRVAFDGTPEAFLRRRAETPVARLCELAGGPERPVTVKAARQALHLRGQILQSSTPVSGAARWRDLTPVLGLRRVWLERDAAILRSVDLRSAPGRPSR